MEQPVEFLSVRVSYDGMFVGAGPGSGVRANSASNATACDERLWAVGASLTWNASAGSGAPTGTPTPGANATLDVRGARAVGSATINGEVLTLPMATVGVVTDGPF